MPYIQFDLPRNPSEDDFDAVAERVASLYAEVMQTTPSGVTVAVRELGARRVLRDGRPVVAIRCDIRSGRPDAQREAFAVALTDLVTDRARELGAAQSVIYFNEGPGGLIFENGQANPDWSPAEATS
ncbi:MAG TPA: tautomerase family protein [Solirubrobacteraceae bacterium]|jgi:phenylpyruvate tautomerase PptA (4-oxalocrotonate tautomerase family)|nr:tautomerase family protein [Solirubrobacteraceae bacterium]